jgi:hypothetical protein
MRRPTASLLLLASSTCIAASLKGQLIAREMVIYRTSCSSEGPIVGDSVQLIASVQRPGGSPTSIWSSPANEIVNSKDHPRLFSWSILPPTRASAHRGKVDLTSRGLLIGREPGELSVKVRALGVESTIPVEVLPRLTRFVVSPRDTTIHTGDTVTVRVEASVGLVHNPEVLSTRPKLMLAQLSYIRREKDSVYSTESRMLAPVPGDGMFKFCFVGRLQTATLHVVGPPLFGANQPPFVRLSPDSTVYVGDDFAIGYRINEEIAGAQWFHSQLDFGDGTVIDNRQGEFQLRHRYTAEGTYHIIATATDSLGRTTVAHTTYHAVTFPVRIVAFPGEPGKTVSLSGPDRYIPLGIVRARREDAIPLLYPDVEFDPVKARADHVPPMRIGRWIFQSPGNDTEISSDFIDVDGDGRFDLVLNVDKRALVRAGELHVGRNRLMVTGATQVRRPLRPEDVLTYIPFRGEVLIDVVK